jgi:hypothetical protein
MRSRRVGRRGLAHPRHALASSCALCLVLKTTKAPNRGLPSDPLTGFCRQAEAWRGGNLAVGDVHRHFETETHLGEFRLGPHGLLQIGLIEDCAVRLNCPWSTLSTSVAGTRATGLRHHQRVKSNCPSSATSRAIPTHKSPNTPRDFHEFGRVWAIVTVNIIDV